MDWIALQCVCLRVHTRFMQRAEPYLELVARNLRVARAAASPKLSQADVAERMRELGFREWRRQTVGNTESGKRRLTVEEVLGLCVALVRSPSALLLPLEGREYVSLPGGQQVFLMPRDASILGVDWPKWHGNRWVEE
jgi:transcriptional regulator with XRE-family HTH domain